MIQEKIIAIPGFPPETSILLKHMMLSHHGQYEYGSPKRPKTIEATILNYLDDLDAKINGIRTHIGKEPESQSRWSSYHKLYDRYFYKDSPDNGQEALAVAPEPEPEPEPVRNTPPAVDREKKGFHNNPFTKLNNENLDLF
jgi:3'-5' exoribonuclease